MKPTRWRPLAGLLDNRSDPDNMAPYSFRRRLNFWSTDINQCGRMPGFEKLFSSEDYNNADLHDQLISLQQYYADNPEDDTNSNDVLSWPNVACEGPLQTRQTGRQPITYLQKVVSSFGSRALLAGTESRLYQYNNSTANWKILADGFGTGLSDGTMPSVRFKSAQLNDAVILTNDYDVPFYWLFGQGHHGCEITSTQSLPDLSLIGLNRAKHVWVFRNVVIFGNVEMDGQRYAGRIVWGDYNNLNFDPANTGSIAGFADLDTGEEILGGAEINNEFLIYTNRGIWMLQATGTDTVWQLIKRYSPKAEGEGCLFYPNTLVSTGGTHYYAGSDGIYGYNLYTPEPERIEWIHAGTAVMFNEICSSCCESHVAEYDPIRSHIILSYATTPIHKSPTTTIIINLERKFVSYMDEGFSAFLNYENDERQTLREWLVENCVCDFYDLYDAGFAFRKEGRPLNWETSPDCPDIQTIFTTVPLYDLYDTYLESVMVEDYEQPTFGLYSLCDHLEGQTLLDGCEGCKGMATFIGACVRDFSLKQMWTAYVREICTNPYTSGSFDEDRLEYTSSVGTYEDEGYTSRLTTGAIDMGEPSDLLLRKIEFEVHPELQAVPSTLDLQTGQAAQAVDPLLSKCTIIWQNEGSKDIECLAGGDEGDLESASRRADDYFDWPTHTLGRYLYWDIQITGTGGACNISGCQMWIEKRGRNMNG